jgi:endoglucanase
MIQKKTGYKILSRGIMQRGILAFFLNHIVSFISALRAIIGFSPCFTGQKRLAARVLYFLSNGYDEVMIKPDGIYHEDKLLMCLRYHVMDFIPANGIRISEKDSARIKETIKAAVSLYGSKVSRTYYRIYLLAILVISISFLCASYLGFRLFYDDWDLTLSEKLKYSVWLFPNIFFLIQTWLFYKTRLKYVAVKAVFKEADDLEVEKLKFTKDQPYVISVVPAYMEDPRLLKRTLYSICLQNYRNMRVVLLLGNDVLSENKDVIKNIKEVRKMVVSIRKDLLNKRLLIKRHLNDCLKINCDDSDTVLKILSETGEIYKSLSDWFDLKAQEISSDTISYPIDSFLIDNNFNIHGSFYKNRYEECLELIKVLSTEGENTGNSLLAAREKIQLYHEELKDLFNIKLSIFMRTKYENLEQEKTKAGNLTAYSSIIGGTWRAQKCSNGRYKLLPSDTGFKIDEPSYLASFDSDTVLKPDYIIRKVAFLERSENSKVGLIQSPYIVPSPEQTAVASASGVYSYWFLTISVGLSAMKNAFWLGFNGVMRFNAVKKIKYFLTDTIIEDTQNSIKLKNAGYDLVTSPEENCTTFSPQDLKALKVQRVRWASGGLEISKKLILDIIKGRSGIKGFKNRFLTFNYALGLNLLPVAATMLYFITLPFFYQYFYAECIPFFLYIISYVLMIKSISNYKLIHIFDGFALNIFLNFYHIIGTLKSFVRLFTKETIKFFRSTPKEARDDKDWIGNVEFIGAVITIIWFWYRLVQQFSLEIYFDLFPVYQIALTLYSVERFHGGSRTISAIFKANKFALLFTGIKKAKNYLLMLHRHKHHKIYKISLAAAILLIIGGVYLNAAYEKRYSENLKKEVMVYLDGHKNKREELDAFQQNKRLGRGISLASALEAPDEGDWGITLKEEYFKIIKEAGFDTVRVPIKWSAHASNRKPYTVKERFFERIDWVLLQAGKNNLNIVLDMHNYDEIYKNPHKHFERFIEIWKQIAERYKDWESNVYFELINEPRDKLTMSLWNNLLNNTIKEIRKIDPYHTIIIDAGDWGGFYGLNGLLIPEDEKNIICSFHTYTPQVFTHQGVRYAPKEYRYFKDIVWPGPPKEPLSVPRQLKKTAWVKEWYQNYNTMETESNPAGPMPIINELDSALSWSQFNNRPLWLGEFGVCNNADNESKANWTRFVAAEAAKRGFSWAYWDFGDTCRVYNVKKKQWNQELLKALINDETIVK